MGNKTPEQNKVVDNLGKFYNSRKEVFLNFFIDYAKMMIDAAYKAKCDIAKQKEREQRAAGLKILTHKQILLQRLSIAFAQVKADNNFVNTFIKMDTIFKNSKNSQISKQHVLTLKFTD